MKNLFKWLTTQFVYFFDFFNFNFILLFFVWTNHFYYWYFCVCVLCIRDFSAFFVEIFFCLESENKSIYHNKRLCRPATQNCIDLLLFNSLISILFGFISVTWVSCALCFFLFDIWPGGNDFKEHFDFRHFIDKNFVF